MNEITRYFRNAVASQTNRRCEYKKDGFRVISRGEIENGLAGDIVVDFLFGHEEEENDEIIKMKDVIIAFKTLENEYENGNKLDEDLEDITSIFFVPAVIDSEGKLYKPKEDKEPWFPREFMEPIVDPELAIGSIETYDQFIDKMTSFRYEDETWDGYVRYAKAMYETVTRCGFTDTYVKSGEDYLKLDGKYYIFEDKLISSTKHIMDIYNDLIEQQGNTLYRKLTNGKLEPAKELVSNTNVAKMKQHMGQMNGKFPLSPSQREALNHFNELNEGDVLAVGGPPGTGKTTLLQSIVADMFVEAAMERRDAPIIVATSMNNQPVTNIIESFRSIEVQGIGNLEHKWITGADKFATYFPSKGKISDAERNGYQYSSIGGKEFFTKIEDEANRQLSRDKFIKEHNEYFESNEKVIGRCVEQIYEELRSVDLERKKIISLTQLLCDKMDNEEGGAYLLGLGEKIDELKKDEIITKRNIEYINRCIEQYKNRSLEWQQEYHNLPFWIRWFKFLPWNKSGIESFIIRFMEPGEFNQEQLQARLSFEDVKKRYQNLLIDCYEQFQQMTEKRKRISDLIEDVQGQIEYIEQKMDEINNMLVSTRVYQSDVQQKYIWKRFTITEINDLVDKIRYKEFWLAAHYYEGEWLLNDTTISEKQLPTQFEKVIDEYYHRMAMISPCFVMTAFMLPLQFLAYGGNDKKNYYMYNYIDLLIVDEAGQISPEMIACSFSLAKKAVVVGDEEQIMPVWGVPRSVDIALACTYGVIENKEQFGLLEENGLNCSQSNIMKVASQSCAYNKYENGLFLSEHRRCFDEIISYCNELVYRGRLEPKRGSAYEIETLDGIPPMGHYQITVEHSQKEGGSRKNVEEAREIVAWLQDNYHWIVDSYNEEVEKGDLDKMNILGIITPFKGQSLLIKQMLNQSGLSAEAHNISVGTVHTFQGAERKIIIFSSVYGNADGSYFIDKDTSVMNVAVSRAKDAFLVFGDKGCFSRSPGKATYLLGRVCEEMK